MGKATEVLIGIAVDVLMGAVVGLVLYRLWGMVFGLPKRELVLEFQRGVLLRNGAVQKVVGKGLHWVTARRRLVVCDMRPRPFQIPSQEMLAMDGMGIRIGLGGEYQIADVVRFVGASTNGFDAFYMDLKQALRATVAEMEGDQLLRGDGELTARLRELLEPRSAHLGVELTKLEVWDAVPIGWVRQ